MIAIWKTLWGTDLDERSGLYRLWKSYLSYLESHRRSLESNLARLMPKIAFTSAMEDYIAWATLGPSLVEGYRVMAQLTERESISKIIQRLVSNLLEQPKEWGGSNALIDLRMSLKEYGVGWNVDIRRKNLWTWLPKVLEEIVSHREGMIERSYLLGILECKNPWDPPPCEVAAINIIDRGAKNRTYAQILEAVPGSKTPFMITSMLSKWKEQERTLRNRLIPGSS